MSKLLKIVLVLILISLLAASFFRNTLCRLLIEEATVRATGLNLAIEEVNLDILSNNLYLRGITLRNPAGFKQQALARIKEISIKYNLLSSLSGRVHLQRLKADISEINIIKNGKGNSNLSTFTPKKLHREPVPQTLAASASRQKPERKGRGRRPKFLIENLEISLDKAVFTDYAAGIGEPAVIIFTLKGPQLFKNVSELSYVVDSVSVKGGFSSLLTEY